MAEKTVANPEKTTAPGESAPDQTFPTIGESDPSEQAYLGEFKTREEAESWVKEAKSKLDGIDEWRRESTEREQRLNDTINRLITSGGPAAASSPASEPLDPEKLFESLPDPVEKPDDFRRGLVQGINRIVSGTVSQLAATQRREQSGSEFYGELTRKHTDIAKYEPVYQAAAAKEAAAIQARGGDPMRAWTVDPDGVLERVANTTRAMLRDMGIDPTAGGNGDAAANGSGAPNRTGGIPGGNGNMNGSGGRDHAPSSFISELKDMQSKSGFY